MYVVFVDGGDFVFKDFIGFDVVVVNILLNLLVEFVGWIIGYCKLGGFVGVFGIFVE